MKIGGPYVEHCPFEKIYFFRKKDGQFSNFRGATTFKVCSSARTSPKNTNYPSNDRRDSALYLAHSPNSAAASIKHEKSPKSVVRKMAKIAFPPNHEAIPASLFVGWPAGMLLRPANRAAITVKVPPFLSLLGADWLAHGGKNFGHSKFSPTSSPPPELHFDFAYNFPTAVLSGV